MVFLDNLTLHYPNEAARHKLLDVIGDLALLELEFKEKLSPTNQVIM
jgi:UDP-3-O-[3-hydroxymyristoyl] N-acetylglucosamine deacetylase/3-hydroxyacyl-[acyl-carrier-protein] dehydratase